MKVPCSPLRLAPLFANMQTQTILLQTIVCKQKDANNANNPNPRIPLILEYFSLIITSFGQFLKNF